MTTKLPPLPKKVKASEKPPKIQVEKTQELKLTYSELLRKPSWQKKRLEIMSRDNWTCNLCGDTETCLNVHHKEYKKNTNPWDYEDSNFVTLCEPCHNEITYQKDNINKSLEGVKVSKSSKNSDTGCFLLIIKFGDSISFCPYNSKTFERQTKDGLNISMKLLEKVL
jgi:hypothetical protein